MNYQNILAELLHIGLVAEKGRCYGRRWKCGYKKALRNHVKALHLLQVSLQSDNLQKKKDAISDFIIICNKCLLNKSIRSVIKHYFHTSKC